MSGLHLRDMRNSSKKEMLIDDYNMHRAETGIANSKSFNKIKFKRNDSIQSIKADEKNPTVKA